MHGSELLSSLLLSSSLRGTSVVRKILLYTVMLAPALLILLSWTSCTAPLQPCLELTAREASIRDYAVRKVLPAFPAEAANASVSGVAVAKVRIDEKGTLSSVEILQAPHPSIAQATMDAVKQWQFKFYENDVAPECFNSKLTFYFVIEDGKAFVRDPKIFEKS
jgi:TonB family protein